MAETRRSPRLARDINKPIAPLYSLSLVDLLLYFSSQLRRSGPPSLTILLYESHTTTIAVDYVTQAAIPARDVDYGPVSNDDLDDDKFPLIEVLGKVVVELRSDKTLSGDFSKALPRVRARNSVGERSLAFLTVANRRRIADITE